MFVYEFLRLMMRLVVLHAGRELQQVEASPVGIVGGPLVSAAPAQANYIIYHQILYSGATIQGSAGVAKFVRYCEVLLYRGTFPCILLLLGKKKSFVLTRIS